MLSKLNLCLLCLLVFPSLSMGDELKPMIHQGILSREVITSDGLIKTQVSEVVPKLSSAEDCQRFDVDRMYDSYELDVPPPQEINKYNFGAFTNWFDGYRYDLREVLNVVIQTCRGVKTS